MRHLQRMLLAAALVAAACVPAAAETPWALVIHGGAGVITRETMDTGAELAYRDKLGKALDAGAAVLEAGGSSLDAVEAAIRFMEDSPLFNAGKGAVFAANGANEMDASVMDGRDRDAGAVAGVTTVRNPISAARAVMEKSPHVMMAREGAEAFAAEVGLEIVDPAYFRTERRWESFLKAREKAAAEATADPDRKHGTVGCVALDRDGNIAAGTSTGGMTYKLWGRIGDSPVIGAGTWADNATCGVSATGHGEYFIRNAVAHDIAARMAYGGLGLQEAAEQVIMRDLVAQRATGGVVALDAAGNIAMVFNTPGMYRGWRKADGSGGVAIYGD
ncbi:isoaspartyl peptidase/L-asparaginase [bacterium]|nr:isoaspartyl peptidase/L-asparaginase [bacterium]